MTNAILVKAHGGINRVTGKSFRDGEAVTVTKLPYKSEYSWWVGIKEYDSIHPYNIGRSNKDIKFKFVFYYNLL